MKWYFLTIAQGIGSLVVLGISFLASILTDGMWFKAGEAGNIMMTQNQTLDVFFKMFGPAKRSLSMVSAFGLFLMVVLYGFYLFKIIFTPIVENNENPFKLTGRCLMYASGIVLIKPIINILLNLATIPFVEMQDKLSGWTQFKESLSSGFSISGLIGGSFGETFKNIAVPIVDTVLFSFSDSAFFIFVFLFIAILIEFLKFFIEVVSRYVLLGVLTIFSPLAFACGPFQSTNNIFQGWIKAFTGQLVLIMFSHFFLKVFTFSWIAFTFGRFTSGIPVFTGCCMLFAWLKIGQKMDTYLQNMGAGTLRSGDDLSMALFGAMAFGKEPASAITNRLTGMVKGKQAGFTFDKNKIGNVTPDGKSVWNRPFSPTRHNAQTNLGRKIMGGAGPMGSGNRIDSLIGNQASNIADGKFEEAGIDMQMSPETIKDALEGKYGFGESRTHRGIDMGLQNQFGSDQATLSSLSSAEISGAKINPSKGIITGYMDNGNGKQPFVLSQMNSKVGMNTLRSMSGKGANIETIQDAFGNNWALNVGDSSDSLESKLGGLSPLGPNSTIKDDFLNGMTEHLPDVGRTVGRVAGGLAGGVVGAEVSGGLGTFAGRAVGSSVGGNIGENLGNALAGRIEKFSGSGSPYSDGSVAPGTPIIGKGDSAVALDPTKMGSENGIGTSAIGEGSVTTLAGTTQSYSGDASEISYHGLRPDQSGVIANIPMDGNMGSSFEIVEGLSQNNEGDFVSMPMAKADFMKTVSSGDVLPKGETYTMSPNTGYVDVNSAPEGVARSIIPTADGGYTYTDSFAQSRANSPLTTGSYLNDTTTGIFELDAKRTLNEDGSYTPGSPIFDTNGNMHNDVDIQTNISGGFDVFSESPNSIYFAGEDGLTYKAINLNDDGRPTMYGNVDGHLESISHADNPSDVQIYAQGPDGETNYVTPMSLGNDGTLTTLAKINCYDSSEADSRYGSVYGYTGKSYNSHQSEMESSMTDNIIGNSISSDDSFDDFEEL